MLVYDGYNSIEVAAVKSRYRNSRRSPQRCSKSSRLQLFKIGVLKN